MLDLFLKEFGEIDGKYILAAGSAIMVVYLIGVWCIARFVHRGTSVKVGSK